MNNLLLIVFSLISVFSLHAQDSLARLDRVIDWQPMWNGEFVIMEWYEYTYNEIDELDQLDIWDGYVGVNKSFYYRDDTLVQVSPQTRISYTPNIVYMIQYGDTIERFDVNSNNEWLRHGEFIWDNGNLVEYKECWTATYQDFRNPYSHTNRYFKSYTRYPGISGFEWINGSYNLIDTYYIDCWSGGEIRWDVVDSIGKWPKDIHVYKDGVIERRFTFAYRDWILLDSNTAVDENISANYKVLSLDYFDLAGRKIKKPAKGLYIERKTTDRGIISKKYFIQ